MSHLGTDGRLAFDAPVSTMEYGSLERGRYDVPLRWPGQHSMYNYPMDQLARRFYEKDRLEFFCMREILFHGKEAGRPMRAASLDYFFGVRFVWPYAARRGERYVFTFLGEKPPDPPPKGMDANDMEMPDYVLINGRKVWQREAGCGLYVTVEYVAAADGPMEIALVKDRFKCTRDYYATSKWEKTMVLAPVCRGYIHLHMGLQFCCEHFGPCNLRPTEGEAFTFPEGMRTFKSPGPWTWVADESVVAYDYPPVRAPEYPTDGVRYNQFHDLYLDTPRFADDRRPHISDRPEVMRQLVRLSLDNGIRCFPQTEAVLQALEAEGLANDPTVTIFFSGGYIKRSRELGEKDTAELQRERRREEGHRLAEVMRRFPKSPVIYRINEFSGCQYCHVTTLPEDQARAMHRPWYEFSRAADEINKEALDEVLSEARQLDAKRVTVGANVQTGYLVSHPLHCGADFILEKTIGGHQANIVVADSRGINMAFGRMIGLQHDAWEGLNYNRNSAREIEAIHRSFFFNGGEFHDAEFGDFAVTREGKGAFNLKGMAWIKVTRLAAIHPRRGRQRVRIGFLRGSDNVWDWYYPTSHTMGLRGYDGYDPADPKEYVDFDLLNIVYPKLGKWMSWNPERWMTGTPYGPCDTVPWDAPVDALKRYKVLPMLGAHRFEERTWRNYVEYVRSGGTLVMGLYQLLAPGRDRVYFRRDVSELLGVKLGEDVALWKEDGTLADRQHFVSQHYNRVTPAGAEVALRLPNGDPLLTRFAAGKGQAYFFTTDRLTTVPGVAEELIRGLLEPHVPVRVSPAHDWMEVAVSEKGDLRLITLMDHGRDRLPTDAGVDTGPWRGTITLELENLGLRHAAYDVLEVRTDEKITRLSTRPVAFRQNGRRIEVTVEGMGTYLELVVGPKGSTEDAFFRT